MDIKVCRTCGKLFQYRGTYQCQDCIRALDEKFVNVRNYVFENPSANMQQICEDNDVSEEAVMKWIREGRLLVSDGAAISLKCQSCGRPIKAGRFCMDCGDALKGQVNAATRDIQRAMEKRGSGIHTESLRRGR